MVDEEKKIRDLFSKMSTGEIFQTIEDGKITDKDGKERQYPLWKSLYKQMHIKSGFKQWIDTLDTDFLDRYITIDLFSEHGPEGPSDNYMDLFGTAIYLQGLDKNNQTFETTEDELLDYLFTLQGIFRLVYVDRISEIVRGTKITIIGEERQLIPDDMVIIELPTTFNFSELKVSKYGLDMVKETFKEPLVEEEKE